MEKIQGQIELQNINEIKQEKHWEISPCIGNFYFRHVLVDVDLSMRIRIPSNNEELW
jgi:hypothetical protein